MSALLKEVIGYATELAELRKYCDKLEWVVYTAGYDFGVDEAYKAVTDYLKNADKFNKIRSVRDEELSHKDARRVELIYREFEPYHFNEAINLLDEKIQKKTNELGQVLNTFRFKLDGEVVTSVTLDQILRNDPDREKRKKAYMAKAQINQPLVDAGFMELIELRKEMAQARGFKDFVAMKLYENELPEDLFDDWKDQLSEYLDEYHSTMAFFANKYVGEEVVQPWDNAYIYGQIAPAINSQVDMMAYYDHVKKLFGKFGFNLDDYPITYDIFPRANKSEWGYNFPIEKGKDSRILANVKNEYNEFNVLLHETGHGVHHFLKDPVEHALDLGVSGIVTEGIANLFGNMIYSPIFYRDFFEDVEVKEQFEQLNRWKTMARLRALKDIFFDQNLYRTEIHSEADIQKLHKDTMKDLFGKVDNDETMAWAYRIHHTTHPIYLHNYFMGDVTADIIKKMYETNEGIDSAYDSPEGFGQFLKTSVIDVSGEYTFTALLKRLGTDGFKF